MNPARSAVTPPSASAQDKILLITEEYKSLRSEIGRFQNYQRQLVTSGIIVIAAAVAATVKENLLPERSSLFLLLPLVIVPISLLFFESDFVILRAAKYLGDELRNSVLKLVPDADEIGIMRWENYRATNDRGYSISRILLFLVPAPLCLLAFVAEGGFRFLDSKPEMLWISWVVLIVDFVGIAFALREFGVVLEKQSEVDEFFRNGTRKQPEKTLSRQNIVLAACFLTFAIAVFLGLAGVYGVKAA